jgi:hypothetical protein
LVMALPIGIGEDGAGLWPSHGLGIE